MLTACLFHNQHCLSHFLSQAGVATDRMLAVLDSNGDLYLTRKLHNSGAGLLPAAAAAVRPATGTGSATVAGVITASGLVVQGADMQQQQRRRLVKLASNVTSPPVWHDTAPMLAAVVDGRLMVWYHPGAAYVDQQLLQDTRCMINMDR
jgi:hypothetical protein